MALATQAINLDLRPHYNKQNTTIVYCSQYDNDLRNVVATITDAGVAVNVSTYTIYIEGTKPDKHGFSYELTSIGGSVANNVVTFPLQLQMTACAGITNAEIVFFSGDERIGSSNFILAVEQAGLAEDIDISETDIPAYVDGAQQAAADAEQAKLDAQSAKDTAVSAAETAENVLESIPADYSELSDSVDDLKSTFAILNETDEASTDEWMIRKNNRGLVKKVDLPSSFGSALNIDIFGDGYTFQTAFDVSINKNDSSSLSTPIVYCSPTGGGNGTTEETPITLEGALNSAYNRNNQTFVLLDGVHCCGYGREIKANINIIAKNKGKAFICGGHATRPSYTVEDGNTYKTGVYNVVKAMQLIDNELYSLSSAESLDECKATSGTAYFTNSAVYVHLYNDVTPSADNVLLTRNVADRPTLNIKNTTQNTNVYLEGVVVVGGCPSALYVSNSSTYTSAKISAKDCTFLNSYDTNNGKVCEIRGADAYFQNCVAKFGSFDGFGYTQANGVGCNFIEINCIGAFNGLDGQASGSPYQNGSTAHQNCKGIRIGGKYFNNYGGNVADVQADCETVNLMCTAFDSESDDTGASADFTAQQAGAIMHLSGCVTFGNSDWNIYAYSGTTMNLTHCRYKTTQGSGTINVVAK